MDWLNLHTSVLDSPEFLGAEPLDRATWLCLLRYCIGQENSGTIQECSEWGDRKWQQFVRVTKKEVTRTCDLWAWLNGNVVVRFYPLDKEQSLQAKRNAGRIGGSSRSDAKVEASKRNAKQNTKQSPSTDPTEGKGREGKGSGREPEPKQDGGEGPEPDPASVFEPAAAKGAKTRTPEQEWHYVCHDAWFVALQDVLGPKLAKSNWRQWKRLVDRYGIEPVISVADDLDVEERWASNAEERLRVLARHTKPQRVSADPVLDKALALVDRLGWDEARKRLSCPDAVHSDAALREFLQINPALAAEMIQERAS